MFTVLPLERVAVPPLMALVPSLVSLIAVMVAPVEADNGAP